LAGVILLPESKVAFSAQHSGAVQFFLISSYLSKTCPGEGYQEEALVELGVDLLEICFGNLKLRFKSMVDF
jgi:hypothetical protein